MTLKEVARSSAFNKLTLKLRDDMTLFFFNTRLYSRQQMEDLFNRLVYQAPDANLVMQDDLCNQLVNIRQQIEKECPYAYTVVDCNRDMFEKGGWVY